MRSEGDLQMETKTMKKPLTSPLGELILKCNRLALLNGCGWKYERPGIYRLQTWGNSENLFVFIVPNRNDKKYIRETPGEFHHITEYEQFEKIFEGIFEK